MRSSNGSSPTGAGSAGPGRARLEFVVKPFDELTLIELHEVARLRIDVFVVEQDCAYPELDGRDPKSTHLLGYLETSLVAYARWYSKGELVVLGRILTHRRFRNQGLGRALMGEAIRRIADRAIRISAQTYLEGFYQKLGFDTVSTPYDDFGIPHVDMVRTPATTRAC